MNFSKIIFTIFIVLTSVFSIAIAAKSQTLVDKATLKEEFDSYLEGLKIEKTYSAKPFINLSKINNTIELKNCKALKTSECMYLKLNRDKILNDIKEQEVKYRQYIISVVDSRVKEDEMFEGYEEIAKKYLLNKHMNDTFYRDAEIIVLKKI